MIADVRRSTGRLADGRRITYFGHSVVEPPLDRRALPPFEAATQLRQDLLLGGWVCIAPGRQDRTHLPPATDCPLCPSRDGQLTEIPAPDYEVVVFDNRFPPLAGSNGRCEIVCFTSDHDASFATLSPDRARLIIDVIAERTAELSALGFVAQVYPFENRGQEIGVTLHHPHGQLYAFPFVTPHTARQLASAREHHRRTGRNLYADLLAAERADGSRVVAAGERWTAFVPRAARWPVEVHLYPHRQVPDLAALDRHERDELAGIYQDVLRRFDALYDSPLPYVAGWHQAPVRQGRDLGYLHAELLSVRRAAGKLKYLAGTESGMGAFSNDVLPEDIARRLREAES